MTRFPMVSPKTAHQKNICFLFFVPAVAADRDQGGHARGRQEGGIEKKTGEK